MRTHWLLLIFNVTVSAANYWFGNYWSYGITMFAAGFMASSIYHHRQQRKQFDREMFDWLNSLRRTRQQEEYYD